VKVRELAEILNAEFFGDSEIEIKKPVPPEEAGVEDTTFLFDPKFDKEGETGVVISTFKPQNLRSRALILVKEKDEALVTVLKHFERKREPRKFPGILTYLDTEAQLEEGVLVYPHTYISRGVHIGKGSVIFPFVFIDEDVTIGRNVIIHPFVFVGYDVKIGDNVVIHSGSVIGADGFGFYRTEKGYIKIPQIGNIEIEEDCEIGANCTIDRATIGTTRIRRGVKLDDQVHVAHNVELGEHTVIAAQTGIAGSTKVGKWVMMGGQVGVSDHIEVGDNAIILAKSGVSKSVPPGGIFSGYFARDRRKLLKIMALQDKLPELFKRVKILEEKLGKAENNTKKD